MNLNEKIERVKNLMHRPGTDGEKAAATAAYERLQKKKNDMKKPRRSMRKVDTLSHVSLKIAEHILVNFYKDKIQFNTFDDYILTWAYKDDFKQFIKDYRNLTMKFEHFFESFLMMHRIK